MQEIETFPEINFKNYPRFEKLVRKSLKKVIEDIEKKEQKNSFLAIEQDERN